MNDTDHEPEDDRLAPIEDTVKQLHVDWRSVVVFAKRRDRESQQERKKVLRMLKTVRATIPDIRHYFTTEDLFEVETAIVEIAHVIESLKKEPETLQPAAPPGSPM